MTNRDPRVLEDVLDYYHENYLQNMVGDIREIESEYRNFSVLCHDFGFKALSDAVDAELIEVIQIRADEALTDRERNA